MAGVTDHVFRSMCKAYGAAFTVTEMVSAKALTLGDCKSRTLMSLSDEERPAGIQLFGSDPEIIAESIGQALQFNPAFIDINMGCPAPKIVRGHAGSALMKDPGTAQKIVSEAVKRSNVPVSVKMRIGWDEETKNHVEFAKAMEAAGAAFLTCHGRTRAQMYAPPADLQAIAEVKRAVSIPVIGNGDVFTPQDAKKMYETTGCDLIAVGRGCLGRPWLFRQINDYLLTGSFSEPDKSEKMRVMRLHAKRICEEKGEYGGILEVRKHALWYTKGMRGAAKLRNRFSTLSSLRELDLLSEIICGQDA
ncbi:MAG: tRNA dihydrouridine synthase DusB [Clostridia bacterium]|nr:tRNA dihydrouridine synthase DusB [Clostridia bacterium]